MPVHEDDPLKLIAVSGARDYLVYVEAFDLERPSDLGALAAAIGIAWAVLRQAPAHQQNTEDYEGMEAAAVRGLGQFDDAMRYFRDLSLDVESGRDGDARLWSRVTRIRYADEQLHLTGDADRDRWSRAAADRLMAYQDAYSSRLVRDIDRNLPVVGERLGNTTVVQLGIFLTGWLQFIWPADEMRSLILTVSHDLDS